jgi:hypothetical protein
MNNDKKKGLSNKNIQKICELIISWSEKLTWYRLVNAIQDDLDIKVSRVTLASYFAIKKEYDIKKTELRGGKIVSREPESSSITELQKKIDKLRKVNEMLERTKTKQLVMIERIMANAREIPNLDPSQLLKQRN